jgi:hypothetical protein
MNWDEGPGSPSHRGKESNVSLKFPLKFSLWRPLESPPWRTDDEESRAQFVTSQQFGQIPDATITEQLS